MEMEKELVPTLSLLSVPLQQLREQRTIWSSKVVSKFSLSSPTRHALLDDSSFTTTNPFFLVFTTFLNHHVSDNALNSSLLDFRAEMDKFAKARFLFTKTRALSLRPPILPIKLFTLNAYTYIAIETSLFFPNHTDLLKTRSLRRSFVVPPEERAIALVAAVAVLSEPELILVNTEKLVKTGNTSLWTSRTRSLRRVSMGREEGHRNNCPFVRADYQKKGISPHPIRTQHLRQLENKHINHELNAFVDALIFDVESLGCTNAKPGHPVSLTLSSPSRCAIVETSSGIADCGPPHMQRRGETSVTFVRYEMCSSSDVIPAFAKNTGSEGSVAVKPRPYDNLVVLVHVHCSPLQNWHCTENIHPVSTLFSFHIYCIVFVCERVVV
ncbi:hypothetical protein BLNAU_25168 [Blattamonas nauphoetae]|uniref:Uncharacterized protein n=1 Tax=Blattamonas nauphoetae TaxID=2049346 RepID=A0ABQ9WKD5_9EUKA|nr:hypothetical protein BLNAU_25168 [Blattamonas nauphoetae]